jgi:hypothetical protein
METQGGTNAMGVGMLRGLVTIWNMELMVLLTAVVLLLSAVAVVEVVALMRGNDQ